MFAVNSLLNALLRRPRSTTGCTAGSRLGASARDSIHFRLSGFGPALSWNVPNSPRVTLFLSDFTLSVICNFRSPACQTLVLEIGETVQILEKSEGETRDREGGGPMPPAPLCGGSLSIPKLIKAAFSTGSTLPGPGQNKSAVSSIRKRCRVTWKLPFYVRPPHVL